MGAWQRCYYRSITGIQAVVETHSSRSAFISADSLTLIVTGCQSFCVYQLTSNNLQTFPNLLSLWVGPHLGLRVRLQTLYTSAFHRILSELCLFCFWFYCILGHADATVGDWLMRPSYLCCVTFPCECPGSEKTPNTTLGCANKYDVICRNTYINGSM